MSVITPEQWEVHQRLLNDYEYFARHIQKIEPKDLDEEDDVVKQAVNALLGNDPAAGMIPYLFHPGQRKLHLAVTDMKRRTGKVRKAMVKPRQVGWSTYIQGRAHWLATKTPGLKVHIVSHSKESTGKFLRRMRRMCELAPPTVTPGKQVENSKELIWSNNAQVNISTAGNPDSMRSDSCHFLHGSEEPYWPDAERTTAAIIPALSKGAGSEGFRESTSQGKGNPWHVFIQECQAGLNDWELFFDPWFNHPKYRATPPPGWEPDDEARFTADLYNLSIEQIYWRAMMIKDLRALWLFKQEFPATVDESFQASADTLCKPDAVYRARKNSITLDPYAPLIIGCDPARTGDRTVLAFRQGKVFREVKIYPKMDDMRLVGIIAGHLRDGYMGKKVTKCFIDYAIGEGAASRLRELGFGSQVVTVHFGETPIENRFANKRAEMAADLRDWLGDTGEHVQIPDLDDVSGDILAIPDFMQSSGSEKLKLPPKDLIKKNFGKSPDIFDAMILTFAYAVAAERVAELQQFARNDFSHMPATELSSIMRDFGDGI